MRSLAEASTASSMLRIKFNVRSTADRRSDQVQGQNEVTSTSDNENRIESQARRLVRETEIIISSFNVGAMKLAA